MTRRLTKLWEDWGLPRIDAWESRSTWLSAANENVFSDLANGYAALYNNPDWSDAIRIATHWYIDALAADVVETALVLCQCGLELLTWTWFKEDGRHTAPANFEAMNANDKIKSMLTQASIPSTIPPHFAELTTASASYPGHDGLGMFILLRNGAVHANKLPRLLAAPVEARHQAKLLGLFFYELLMLYAMDYGKGFKNRIGTNPWSSAEENVPWVP